MRKIVQFQVLPDAELPGCHLIVLCDDGTMWAREGENSVWVLCPDVPQKTVAQWTKEVAGVKNRDG